jgi:hypothetical protein
MPDFMGQTLIKPAKSAGLAAGEIGVARFEKSVQRRSGSDREQSH